VEHAELAARYRARIAAFERFSTWEESHPATLTASDAVASIGALYELLPSEARRRPVDPSGVACMQNALRVLSR
jgi:hypothetical protein